jgi:hypothetical protein
MDLKNIEVLANLMTESSDLICKVCKCRIDWSITWETLSEAIEIADNHKCNIESKVNNEDDES